MTNSRAAGGTHIVIREREPAGFGPMGLGCWDVDRLLTLSRDLPVRLVDVESITEVASVYWFDDTELPTVRAIVEHVRLIQDVDTSRPIILGHDGRVMDGMHRIARAMLAVRFTTYPEPDYLNCRPGELPY